MQAPRSLARLGVAVALIAGVFAFAEPATAITVPETLADRRPVQAGPVEPGFPIDYVGVIWDEHPGAHGHEHADEHAEEVGSHGAVRFRTDGVWSPWQPLIPDGAQAEGQWTSGLVRAGDADAYQVRGLPAAAEAPRAVAINTTDGPRVEVGEQRGDAAGALSSSKCRSRADWGADPNLMTWAPDFYPVQALTVHHTATDNNDPDPEATVRAIYRYHSVDNGWGDIGYQYLIDEQGIVYEGRWSGTESQSCEIADPADKSFGDGSDFGHETDGDGDLDGDGKVDEMVSGAHVGGYNSGNMGVALLGDFTDHPRFGGEPTTAAVASLEDVLTELSVRHKLNPTGTVNYQNPVTGYEENKLTVDTISGHRDWSATECPGDRLYAQLPTIRNNVKAAMGTDQFPSVNVTHPTDSPVSGSVTVTADATDDNKVTQVAFTAAGVDLGTDLDGTDGWSAPTAWNTANHPDGSYTVSATATDDAKQSATHSVTVTVDNVADPEPDPTLSVTGTTPSTIKTGSGISLTVDGSGFVDGATVAFENGKGQAPIVTNITWVSETQIDLLVTVEAKGPAGTWDVRVSLPDGRSAVCVGCLTVQR